MRKAVFTMMLALVSSAALAEEASSAKSTLESFYSDYFQAIARPGAKRPEPPFSHAFIAARKENAATCKDYAGTDVCGWAADGDPYLDAQESDSHLTFKSSGMDIEEYAPGYFRVTLNVMPGEPEEPKGFYNRKILYKLVQEKKRWVVDDMAVGGEVWAREAMDTENKNFKEHPGPKALKAPKPKEETIE